MSIASLVSRLVGCVVALGLAAGPVRADVVQLGAVKDNTLYEDISGSTSNGQGQYVFAGHTNAGNKRRALIAFDIAGAVPAGSTVDSVTLSLSMSRTQAGSHPVTLHRVLADWGEGGSVAGGGEGSGDGAAPGDATWLHRFYDTTFWTSQGGDFVAGASATRNVAGNGTYTWMSAGMVADVQGWLDAPASNFGWVVVGNELAQPTAKRFDSRQNLTPANRPLLAVTFTPPALDGACCLPGQVCSVLTPGDCATQGGVYQGNDEVCLPDTCVTTGACCAVDGSCSELGSAACASSGGSYQGDGTSCLPGTCPEPTGACCAADGTCSIATPTDCGTQGGSYQGDGTNCSTLQCPISLAAFVDPLPIPAVAQPVTGLPGGTASYEISMTQFQQKLHRDLPPTTLWGFESSYPGPTIEAAADEPVTVTWINDLRDAQGNLRVDHYLPVDNCPHGADDASPRTVVHLHGAHVPAEFDGYPEDTFLPGQMDVYEYPNHQLPATLWYHDHALGITRLNVYLGLAGFYLIRDPLEASLGLPSGEFEIPLLIQDKTFAADGSLIYPAAWQDHYFGDKILVNGKVWPNLKVKQGKYRFRLLNGSGSRTLTLSLSMAGLGVWQIGTDGGLLPAPVPVSQVSLGPAERADLVIDFAGLPSGTEVLLVNSAPAPFPGSPGVGVVPEVMKFVVLATPGYTAPLPATLRPIETLLESNASVSRDFVLRKESDPCAGSVWLINGLHWDHITEYPELGETEVWRFINSSGVSHPMHLHLVMFQVLDRQPFTVVDDEVVPVGMPVPPASEEAGWKDTAMAPPGQITRVIARFEDYPGKFAYHCHILEHEDHEMMRQFWAVSCGNAILEPTEECDDAGTLDGDACSAGCEVEQYLELAGVGQGGGVTVTIDGVTVGVSSTNGLSAAEVAAALAAAIQTDPTLAAAGVTATVDGGVLVTNGTIQDVAVQDSGLVERLSLAIGPDLLWWSSVGGRIGHDVVRGDLGNLRDSGGFSAATDSCLADDRTATYLGHSTTPPTGQAYWYLVRKVGMTANGSYDAWGSGQAASRDAGIAASGQDCP